MVNINTALVNNRLMNSVIGMSAREFKQLSGELEKNKQSRYKKGLKKGRETRWGKKRQPENT